MCSGHPYVIIVAKLVLSHEQNYCIKKAISFSNFRTMYELFFTVIVQPNPRNTLSLLY